MLLGITAKGFTCIVFEVRFGISEQKTSNPLEGWEQKNSLNSSCNLTRTKRNTNYTRLFLTIRLTKILVFDSTLLWRGCWQIGVLSISGGNANECSLRGGHLGSFCQDQEQIYSLTQKCLFKDVILKIDTWPCTVTKGQTCSLQHP